MAYATGAGAQAVTATDFDGDGNLDVAVANYDSNNVSVFMGYGNGTFRTLGSFDCGSGAHPRGIAAGDLNGDGRPDLAVANTELNAVAVFVNNGNGTFQAPASYAVGLRPFAVAVGDFNADGRQDLAVANDSSGNVSVLRGNGDGTFQGKIDYNVGGFLTSITASDINGDSRFDLVVGGDNVSFLLGQGDGTFRNAASSSVPAWPNSVVAADFNGDGQPDVATANGPTNTVSVLLNRSAATHLSVTVPAESYRNAPTTVTVTALNGSDAVDTGYRGTVRFESDYPALLPPDYTFVAEDNGTHSFAVTPESLGDTTLTVSDTSPGVFWGTAILWVVGDGRGPTVTLDAPEFANQTALTLAVTANDQHSGVADGAVVTVDVDWNHDGNFDEWNEASWATSELIAGAASLVIYLPEGSHSLRARVSDQAGNEGVSAVSTVVVDTTPPTISAAADRAPNANGWYNADVTVTFTAEDALAGIASVTDPVTLGGEDASQSVIGTATDRAGNTTSFTVHGINVDKTLPMPVFDGPFAADEGTSVRLDATRSWDALSGMDRAVWSVAGEQWNDPAQFAVIDGPDELPVILRITDVAGNVTEVNAALVVNNVAPTVEIADVSDETYVGASMVLQATVTDPGTTDTFTYAWNVTKDGQPYHSAGTPSFVFTPDAPGSYVASLTVIDDDGGTGSAAVSTVAVQRTVFWDGGGDGVNWNDPSNWSSDTLPGPADDVTIDVPGNITVWLGGSAAINAVACMESLSVSQGTPDLTEASQIASLALHNANLFTRAEVTVAERMDVNAGRISGSGTVDIAAAAELRIESWAEFDGVTIDNEGTTIWANGTIYAGNGAVFNNSGYFEARSEAPGDFSNLWGNEGPGDFRHAWQIGGAQPVFNNTGMLVKPAEADGAALTGATQFPGVIFNNQGAVQVGGGTMSFLGTGTSSGSYYGAPGTVLGWAGEHAFTSTSSIVGDSVAFAPSWWTSPAITVGGSYHATGDTSVAGPGGDFSGDVHFTGNVTSVGLLLYVGGGVNLYENSIATEVIDLRGRLFTSAEVTVTERMDVNAARIGGSGTVNIAAAAELRIESWAEFDEVTIDNEGTTIWANGTIYAGNGAVFNNSGYFEARSEAPGDFSNLWGNEGPGDFRHAWQIGGAQPVFNNTGTLAKPAEDDGVPLTGATQFPGVVFNNEGTVQVGGGTLSFLGTGTSSGSYYGAPGTVLGWAGEHAFTSTSSIVGDSVAFAPSWWTSPAITVGGSYHATGDTSVAGPGGDFSGDVHFTGNVTSVGLLLYVGGGVNLYENSIATEVIDLRGRLFTSGNVTVTERMDVAGYASIWGPGAVNIASSAQLEITEASEGFSLNGSTINNAGKAVWIRGYIAAENGAQFNNSGTFEAQSENPWGFHHSGGDQPMFSNTGLLVKPTMVDGVASTGMTLFNGVALNNAGTVEAGGGWLQFTGGYTQSWGETRLNGGNIESPTPLDIQEGTVTGSGIVSGGVLNGGLISPGFSAGMIEIQGDYAQQPSGELEIEIAGLAPGSEFDQLQVDGSIILGGTLNVVLSPSFTPEFGDTFVIVDNEGDDAIIGTFNGMDEGATLPIGDAQFEITYCGGADDNDVVLTFTASPLVVSNTSDSGFGSLRNAIDYANGNSGLDTITFNIPTSDANHVYYRNDGIAGAMSLIAATTRPDDQITDFDPDYPGTPFSWYRIRPTSALPRLTESAVVDGYTQPGALPNTQAVGSDAVLRIELDGTQAGFAAGLWLNGGESLVRGLAINRFQAHGILVTGAEGNTIAGNFIGTDVTGTKDLGNGLPGWTAAGVGIFWSGSNLVGTDGDGMDDAAERNVISGNENGVLIWEDPSVFSSLPPDCIGSDADGNVVAGNYIGTSASGTRSIPNVNGIWLGYGADWTRVGTDGNGIADAAERNVISGNNRGVSIKATSHTTVAGNYIGTDARGMAALGNTESGVFIYEGSQTNWIGTNGDGAGDEVEGNLIAANARAGVWITGGAMETIVAGNSIGTDVLGTRALGNLDGVRIDGGASGNRIGTDGNGVSDLAERNIIAGNTANGVGLYGVANNVVAGNFIGTDVTGASPLGNARGVTISGGARSNWIGTNGDGQGDEIEGNVIAASFGWDWQSFGVCVEGAGTQANVVAGNRIGTDASGTLSLPNTGGVFIRDGAAFNRVGTNGDGVGDAAERNLVSGNSGNGVAIYGVGSDGNIVAGNYIGTGVCGSPSLGNAGAGVSISDAAHSNRIGTDGNAMADAAERNVISGNSGAGVSIAGSGSTENIVAGNYIGTNAAGSAALANGWAGVYIENGVQNRIGTNGDGIADAAERNIISGNNWRGIELTGAGTRDNIIAGNYIGTDATGSLALGNREFGVGIDGAGWNRIGTDGNGIADDAERNIISANLADGVGIWGAGADGNVIAGNFIGTDVTGSSPLGNAGCGVIVGGARANRIGTAGDGTADSAERNIISANGSWGVGLWDASQNVVAGNSIGTNADGSAALGNGGGVGLWGQSPENRIGTNGDGIADAAERNLISGNAGNGIGFWGSGTRDNVVAGNYVGTEATGAAPLGNGGVGVEIVGSAENRIGTNGDGLADEAERNVISANGRNSGLIYAPAAHVTLSGNGQSTPPMIVNRLTISGNGGSALTADGFSLATPDVDGGLVAPPDYGHRADLVPDDLAQLLWLNELEKTERWRGSTGRKADDTSNVDAVFAWWE